MQAMAPLIHGHLDIDHATTSHGLHLHEDEAGHAFSGQHGHFIHDSTHVAHTVAIATGIKKDQDYSAFAKLTLFFVVMILTINIPSARFSPFKFEPLFKPLFRRRPSSPRAPPY